MNARISRPHGRRRRGAVVVLVALSMIVILGCTALAIDLALLYMNRNELQRAADAAALAGASAYFTDSGLAQDIPALTALATARADEYSRANTTQDRATQVLVEDIVLGHHDYNYPRAELDTSSGARYNAVEVTTRRTEASPNGAVTLFFARTFGISTGDVIAIARAAADDRAGGFSVWELKERENPPLLPITIDFNLYDELASTGGDDFSYESGAVRHSSDGVREVSIYPWRVNLRNPLDLTDDVVEPGDGAGNFGLLDFGADGTPDLAVNIQNGLTPEMVQSELGTADLQYTNEDGSPHTYSINGETGMRAALIDDFRARIGDVVGIFVHDSYTGSGTSTMFRNVGIRFVRIMYVNMHGAPSSRRVTCQPVAYDGSAITVNQGGESTKGQLGRITLVR